MLFISKFVLLLKTEDFNAFVKQGENALPYISDVLQHSNNETQITETIYILNRMIDSGTKNIDKILSYINPRFRN